ncbi:FG-GAP repeat domain-containing protein [Parapedobacter lycopersici]|uniref:FG-GAP repeat domain-containing protein n=1 Tax=Parapedobacter lycopersici TaxID=1864939 RepID=UPI00214DD252|nr:VCBS repeat-containing protein [Parapedobacter lycopersici]
MKTIHLRQTTAKCMFIIAAATTSLYGCAVAQSDETAYFRDVTATHVPADPDAHALDAALADVDNDGDLDVILALEAAPNRLYINDGNGVLTWKKGAFTEVSHDMEHIRIADMDNDGILDCIFVAEDDQNHEYYLGNSDGTFRDVSDRLPAKSEGNGLDVGDVDGDGLPDIVVGNSGAAAQNFLWINDPDRPGYFIDRTKTHLPAVEDQTQSIKLADLDGDGDLDMVIGNEVPPNRLLLNDGQGRFTEHADQLDLPTPLHTREVLVFDVDNDGDLDIVFANLTSNGGERDKDPRTRLLLNDGNARFTDVTESQLPNNTFSTYAAAPFDIDRDGHPDLLLSAMKIPPFEAMQVHAYRNDGKGNFTDVTGEVIPETTVGRSWGIAVGDLNGDGLPDVFIGGWGSQARLLLAR